MKKLLVPLLVVGGLLVAGTVAGLKLGFPSWFRFAADPTPPAPPSVPAVAQPKPPEPATVDASTALRLSGTLAVEASLSHRHVVAGEPQTVYLNLLLRAARGEPSEARRLPMNLVLVVDRSGSMESEGKLVNVKAAAKAIVAQMQPDDCVALVTYSSEAQVAVPARRVDDREAIRTAIDAIDAGGSTNLSAGLQLGQAEARKNLTVDRVSRVLLLSDGMANCGITDPLQLHEIARTTNREGIRISALGVGTSYNEDLMTDLAEYGGGNYHFIEDAGSMTEVFARELKQMQRTVCQRVNAVLEPQAGAVVDTVYGYKSTREGDAWVVAVGDLASEQERKVVASVRVPATFDGKSPLLRLTMRYEDALARKAVTDSGDVGLGVTADRALAEKGRNLPAMANVEAVQAAETWKQAAENLSQGKADAARTILSTQIERSRRANQAFRNESLNGQIRQMEGMLDNLGASARDERQSQVWIKRSKALSYEYGK